MSRPGGGIVSIAPGWRIFELLPYLPPVNSPPTSARKAKGIPVVPGVSTVELEGPWES